MDVLPRQAADAIVNMAADQMLLEHYPAPDRVRFRPFAWSEPSYTFGVSQAWAKYRALIPAHFPTPTCVRIHRDAAGYRVHTDHP